MEWTVGLCSPFGQAYATNYRVSFSHAHGTIVLYEGVPEVNLHAQRNETLYFKYSVMNPADVMITLTSETGVATVIVCLPDASGP
jgi:hypothetical protein